MVLTNTPPAYARAVIVWFFWRRMNNEKHQLERRLDEIKKHSNWADANTRDADNILDELQVSCGMDASGQLEFLFVFGRVPTFKLVPSLWPFFSA